MARWGSTEWFKRRMVRERVERWQKRGMGNKARWGPGKGCLVNEMQVLVENGWAHV